MGRESSQKGHNRQVWKGVFGKGVLVWWAVKCLENSESGLRASIQWGKKAVVVTSTKTTKKESRAAAFQQSR